jgi:hypothetical protein
MNKILSTSVTKEQYSIIKKIAENQKKTLSQVTKESIQVYIALYYVGDILSKLKLHELTEEAMERNSKILEHAEEMTKLMQPYVEQIISSIPHDVMKAVEDEGLEFEEDMKKYVKPVKRGRPPALVAMKGQE